MVTWIKAFIFLWIFHASYVFAASAQGKVLFWNTKNLGFGHVSLEIYEDSLQQDKPSFYLSYAMGNKIETDKNKHEIEPLVVELPVIEWEQFILFKQWLQDSPYFDPNKEGYGQDYNLITHNCAHAVLYALRNLGYEIDIEGESPIALTPARVYRSSQRYLEQD